MPVSKDNPKPQSTTRRVGRPTAPRSREHLDGHRARDKEVVETAVRLFFENGYAATSVQDVADELGMLKGSLYYYIDTKETLLRRIFETSHSEVEEIVERHRDSPALPRERLRAFLKEQALWYATHTQRASLFSREWRHASGELRERMLELRRYYNEALESFVVALKDTGEVDPEIDVRLATYFVMSAVTSLPDWYRPNSKLTADEISSRWADMAMKIFEPA